MGFFLIWSCNSNEYDHLEGDEKAVVDKTREFLNWYGDNYHRVLSLTDQLVPNSTDSILDNPYSVDFSNAESYVDYLDSSGFFSKGYILDLYNYLQDCDRRMRLVKQNDGPPIGLEVDPILKTHEPADIFKMADSCTVKSIEINQQRAVVRFGFIDEKEFTLVKIEDRWYLE